MTWRVTFSESGSIKEQSFAEPRELLAFVNLLTPRAEMIVIARTDHAGTGRVGLPVRRGPTVTEAVPRRKVTMP